MMRGCKIFLSKRVVEWEELKCYLNKWKGETRRKDVKIECDKFSLFVLFSLPSFSFLDLNFPCIWSLLLSGKNGKRNARIGRGREDRKWEREERRKRVRQEASKEKIFNKNLNWERQGNISWDRVIHSVNEWRESKKRMNREYDRWKEERTEWMDG